MEQDSPKETFIDLLDILNQYMNQAKELEFLTGLPVRNEPFRIYLTFYVNLSTPSPLIVYQEKAFEVMVENRDQFNDVIHIERFNNTLKLILFDKSNNPIINVSNLVFNEKDFLQTKELTLKPIQYQIFMGVKIGNTWTSQISQPRTQFIFNTCLIKD
ncbi:MAG: hypothetical protein NTX61_02415 [Bacteroidetes bacterium]|nr:hypothetical protein [Bacteroidota bacterium]